MAFRLFISIFLLSAVVILSGCGGPERPADLPRLYPCTVTVVQDGRPLEEAIVNFISIDPSFKWSVFARLDASGTGKVFTQGLFPGAPEGEYKVVLSKEDTVTEKVGRAVPPTADDGGVMVIPIVLKVFTLVEKDYTDAATTPLSIVISRKNNAETFDCGKPVKEFLYKVSP